MNPAIQLQKLQPAMQRDRPRARPHVAVWMMCSLVCSAPALLGTSHVPLVGSGLWQCRVNVTALFISGSLEEEAIRTGAPSSPS